VTTILLFDAYTPGDAALENSHWMAERTRERLGDDATTLTYPDAVRVNLESHLGAEGLRGLTVFGHGDPGRLHTELRMQYREGSRAARADASKAGAIYGSDDAPALDIENLHLLRGLWCHALACNVGLSLAHRAIEPGALCFVAYETSLTPEFETDTLPHALRSRLETLVTTTTLNLHAGLRGEIELKGRIKEAIDELGAWLDCDEGSDWIDSQAGYMQVAGLLGFAYQLWRDMVVRVAEGCG
jgi:hypothetical protein